MNKFIFDELTRTPSILAVNRIHRPDGTGVVTNKTAPVQKVDLFAKGNEHLTPATLYQDADDWNVRVFANKYPVVDNHEIIVHSPDTTSDLEDLSVEQSVRYIRALLQRVFFHYSQNREAFIFSNRGGKAGASILHPHSQLISLEGFPGKIEEERQGAIEYYNENNSCYWCDLVKNELSQKDRIVYESPHFVALIPKASRWSYEMKLLPKKHNPNFGLINEAEINDLAKILKAILGAYNDAFSRPDRNFWIHTQRYDPYHWHIGFIPQIKILGGIELGAGIWINDRSTPEDAAKLLGESTKKYYESVESVA